MCVIDSTFVVLGGVKGSEQSLHVRRMTDTAWSSIGSSSPVPATGGDIGWGEFLARWRHHGSLACIGNRILHARSSDGTVQALRADGTIVWKTKLPVFSGVHDYVASKNHLGQVNGMFNLFDGLAGVQDAIVVQFLNPMLSGETLTTVILDAETGKIIGGDRTLPRLISVSDDQIAVLRERPMPEVAIYSLPPR
jgi:hypothetical protein